MKTYRLFHKSTDFKSINLKGTALENALSATPFAVHFEDFSDTNYSWVNENDMDSDAPFIDGCIPVLSQKAFDVLSPLFNKYSKSVRIHVNGEPYYIIYGEQIIEGALNEEKSKIRYFRDGRIMQIKEYAINNKPYPSIFKVKEDLTFDFVTEDVIRKIDEAGLKGFGWVECTMV